jgi:sec-independent protein translocase protein TatC
MIFGMPFLIFDFRLGRIEEEANRVASSVVQSKIENQKSQIENGLALAARRLKPDMTEPQSHDPEVRMSLGDHLEELRRRLIYAFIGVAGGLVVGLVTARPVILAMEYPYHRATAALGMPNDPLVVLTMGGGFDLYMRTALWIGVVLGSPWIIYQLWAFVSAGLLPRERRMVRFSVPFFVVLFLAGAAFFLLFVAVPAFRFLLYFDTDYFTAEGMEATKAVITLQSYIGLVTEMVIVFGLAFQTPLVVLVLAKIGLVTMGSLRRFRRHVIVAIAAFSAVFAPPDALSMIVLGVSMWMLYELGVVLAYFLALRKAPTGGADGEG